jgi:glycosyltransferase involved in cell wall biosynthesis
MGQRTESNRCSTESMKSKVPFRVAIYDPSGQGGICHYTYQLAENLALKGNEVTVLTGENFELMHLPRHFKLKFLFKQSWIKRWAGSVIASVRRHGSNYKNEISIQEPAADIAQTDSKIGNLNRLRNLRLRLIWLKAAFFLLRKRPHLVHLQWLVDRNQDYFFINLLKLLGFQVVYTVHDLVPLESDAHFDYNAIEQTYRRVDALIVHSENNKKELATAFDVDQKKIYVIPHGSNDLFYMDKEMSKEPAREELGLPRKKKVILFFGIIKRYKGLEYLVEAFQDVQEQVDNVMLLVVGRIYDKDREGLKYYSELIGQLRGRENVLCVEDYVPLEKIALYFSAADLVVLPYVKNYTSGILLSAYAAGRPVVVTDTGGLSEVVESGKSGVVVPSRDSSALSRAIIETFNRSDIEKMGSYAKHLAETRYSWKSVAEPLHVRWRTTHAAKSRAAADKE